MGKLLFVACLVAVCSLAATVEAQQPYATHNIGNVNFTVTWYGACGFMTSAQIDGEGFKYPLNGSNHLFFGGIAAGNSAGYLCDRYFGVGMPGPDNTDWNNVAGLNFGQTVYSDQDGWAQYDDSGHPTPAGILVTQDSWAWADPPYDDFVIFRFTFENLGYDTVTDFHVGQFMDFDVIDGYYNYADTDPTRRLAYMWYDAANPYCGIKLLDPTTAANLSVIDHLIWVYPDSMLSDGAKFRFMDGTLHQGSGTANQDWSVVVSAGPFTLMPGDIVVVGIAVLGGDNLSDLQTNADNAQAKYDFLAVEEAQEERAQIPHAGVLQNYPNPFSHSTTIHYTVPDARQVTVQIYDLGGRLVTTVVDGEQGAGYYSVSWDGRDSSGRVVPNGVYFYRLQAGQFTSTRKLTILR